jgi:hypothetical protein
METNLNTKIVRLLINVLVGAVMGLLTYIILLFINNSWEEVIATLLIGSVWGVAQRKKEAILIGALSLSIGWLAGTWLFGIFLGLGLGAWILAGASLGLIVGLYNGSFRRGLAGLLLGAVAGLIVEASRYITLISGRFRVIDMQLILLLTAGILLPSLAALVSKPSLEK